MRTSQSPQETDMRYAEVAPATEELLSVIGACIVAIDEQTRGDKE